MPFIRKVRVLCKTRLIFPRINGPIGKRMLFSVEQAFVKDEKRAPLKTPAWESRFLVVLLYFDD